MDKLILYLILFGILFLIIFIVDYIFINRPHLKKKKKNKSELMEIEYLVHKFKLDKKLLPMKKLLLEIAFINALIISFVAVIIMLIDINIILQLIIGFILLMALIYSLYEILGNHLVKKGYGKNGI